jgi:hypothetical protein
VRLAERERKQGRQPGHLLLKERHAAARRRKQETRSKENQKR